MGDDVLLWPPTCTCNKYIGHLAKRYYQLKQEGIPPNEAMTRLGIIDICCRTNVLTPVNYSMSATQSGVISEFVVDPSHNVRSFPIRGGIGPDDPKALTYGIPTSSRRTLLNIKDEDNDPDKASGTDGDLTEVPEVAEVAEIPELMGIEEPISEFDLSKAESGKIASVGYLRDDYGNIVTEIVGSISGKVIRVPVLKLKFKI